MQKQKPEKPEAATKSAEPGLEPEPGPDAMPVQPDRLLQLSAASSQRKGPSRPHGVSQRQFVKLLIGNFAKAAESDLRGAERIFRAGSFF
jgi:hypothetical protein